MIEFKATLEKFGSKGEKTGWTYIEIPSTLAQKIKPGTKKSFRIKGKIDGHPFRGAVLPMGGGDFIFAINAVIRKKIKKFKGDTVVMRIEEDTTPPAMNKDLMACLAEDQKANSIFQKLPPSHRNYYSKWVGEAKTEATRAKRIAMLLDGLPKGWDFGQMLHEARNRRQQA